MSPQKLKMDSSSNIWWTFGLKWLKMSHQNQKIIIKKFYLNQKWNVITKQQYMYFKSFFLICVNTLNIEMFEHLFLPSQNLQHCIVCKKKLYYIFVEEKVISMLLFATNHRPGPRRWALGFQPCHLGLCRNQYTAGIEEALKLSKLLMII